MIENGYSENINVRYSEMDYDKSLKPFSILNYFQDIASDNAENLGFGYSYITPKNLMWVLLKYRIEFEEYPVGIHDIKVVTQPRGYNKLFAYRDFELYGNNKLVARAASMWSLVDIASMSIASIEKSLEGKYTEKYVKKEDDLQFEKIPALNDFDIQKEFEVRYNDLDVNRHANNGNYIVWAFEPLSYDFKTINKPKTIDMMYKKELKLGEKLISCIKFLEDKKTVHILKNAATQEDICLIQCKWAELC